MIRALYTAGTGMNAQELNVSTISNNIGSCLLLSTPARNCFNKRIFCFKKS